MIESYKIKRNIYIVSLFLYNLARVLPHAVLTVILLNKGITITEIAIIQSFYMLAAILFEFPSGLVSDLLSEKMMYQMSLILIIVAYYLIFIASNYYILCFTWFIYGVSAASMSGSLDAYFIRNINNEKGVKDFNILMNHSLLISGLVGGGLGASLYSIIGNAIYTVSIVLLVSSLLLITFCFKIQSQYVEKKEDTETTRVQIKNTKLDLKKLYKTKVLMIYIIQFAIFQLVTQLFYQFWQVMFLKHGISQNYFGIFYILFQLIAIASNIIFSKSRLDNKILFLAICIFITFMVTTIINDNVVFIISIMIFLVFFNLYSNQLTLEIQKRAPKAILATVISFSGTITSVCSVIALWGIGILNKCISFNTTERTVVTVFLVLTLLLLLYKQK